MYLKKIILQNFQSWKKQHIELDPGFNAIVGDSDSGKSAIERAIRWVVENRPSGDEFVSWTAKEDESTYVKLIFDDTFVTRKKIGKKNQYKTEDMVFEKFKSDVPSEIKNIIDMKEYNIQSQHNDYFLLQETPGERARILNQAVGLDIIDELFGYLNGKSLELNRSLKNTITAKENLSEELKKYSDLDEIEDILNKIKTKSDLLKSNNLKLEKGYSLIGDLKNIRSRIKNEKKWVGAEPKCTLISANIAKWDHLQGIKLKSEETLRSIKDIRKNMTQESSLLERNIKEYIKILSENKTCPVCNSDITKKVIERIKDNLT